MVERPALNHVRKVFCPLCEHENTFGANEGVKPCALCTEPVTPISYTLSLRVDRTDYYGRMNGGDFLTLNEAIAAGEQKYAEDYHIWGFDVEYINEMVW